MQNLYGINSWPYILASKAASDPQGDTEKAINNERG